MITPAPARWQKPGGLNRPGGSRAHLGALLLADYAPDGRLVYAGRARAPHGRARAGEALSPPEGAGDRLPLDVPPARTSRFGSPLVLSRLDWVRPDLVAEVAFLTGPTMACYGMSSIRAPRRQAGDGGCGASLLLASSQLVSMCLGLFPRRHPA